MGYKRNRTAQPEDVIIYAHDANISPYGKIRDTVTRTVNYKKSHQRKAVNRQKEKKPNY